MIVAISDHTVGREYSITALRKIIPLVLIILFSSIALIGYSGSNKKFIGPPFGAMAGQDFRAVFRAAQEIMGGNDPYIDAIERGRSIDFIQFMSWEQAPYVYPPFYALLATPLLNLKIDDALILWAGINLLLLVGSAYLAAISFVARNRFIWAVFFFIIFNFYGPTQLDLRLGQADIFLLFLLFLTYYLYTKNNGLAALPLAFAISIKPFLIILIIFFLWKKCYRMVLWTFVVVGLLFILGFLFVGVSSISSWLEVNRLWVTGDLMVYPTNQSISGFLQRLFTSNAYIQPLADMPWLTISASLIAGGLALLLWLFLVDRNAHPGGDKIGFSLTITTMMLILPLAEDIHFVWLLFPMAALLSLFEVPGETPFSVLLLIPVVLICIYLGLPDLNDVIYLGWEALLTPGLLVEKMNLVFTGAYLYGLIGLEIFLICYQVIRQHEN